MRSDIDYPKIFGLSDEEYARITTSFRYHCEHVWRGLGLPPLTPPQHAACEYIQNGPQLSILLAYRGMAKSYLTGAMPSWEWMRDPDKKVIPVSASQDYANEIARYIKNIMHLVPYLQPLLPKRGQLDSVDRFDNGLARTAKEPSVRSLGILGQTQGPRGDIIIGDDLETKRNATSVKERVKIRERVGELNAILKPGPKSRIVLLGTHQVDDSLYEYLARECGFHQMIIPFEYPNQYWMMRYGSYLEPTIKKRLENNPEIEGKLVDPRRFSEADRDRIKATFGNTAYQREFQLDPSSGGLMRNPLVLSDLIVMDLDHEVGPLKPIYAKNPELVYKELPCVGKLNDAYYRPAAIMEGSYGAYEDSVICVDPSGRGQDEFAWVALKYLNGYIFVVDVGGFVNIDNLEDGLKALAQCAKRHKIKTVNFESNFGGSAYARMFAPVVQAVHPECRIIETHSTGSKEQRIIDTLEPLLNQHRLVVTPEVVFKDYEVTNDPAYKALEAAPLDYSLFHQLVHITKEKDCLAHDDRLDALEMGARYFLARMGGDQAQALERNQVNETFASLYKLYGKDHPQIKRMHNQAIVDMVRVRRHQKALLGKKIKPETEEDWEDILSTAPSVKRLGGVAGGQPQGAFGKTQMPVGGPRL